MGAAELIPCEVWAVIIGYADFSFESNFGAFRLLCRSMLGGLDEWIRQGMEDGVKEDGSLRLGLPGVQSSVPPLRLQKVALLAVSRAPKEFLWSVSRLPTTFLSHYSPSSTKYQQLPVGIDIVQSTLLELKNVTRIDGPFLMNLRWPDTDMDLSHMTQLKVIGNGFLRGSVVRNVLLPSSLEVIGDGFMECSRTSRVDLSHTAVERIGSGFLSLAIEVKQVLFSSTLRFVGDNFLAENYSLKKLDLSGTLLESVGGDFLCSTHVDELFLPSTLKLIGSGFLSCGGTRILDLSHTAITDMNDATLLRGRVQEVILPRTVEKIGDGFLKECRGVKKVDLSRTKVATVGHSFLTWTSVDELILPATMQSCSSLNEASIKKIDLSRVGVEFHAPGFLRPNSEVELVLPSTFQSSWTRLFRDGKGDKATVRFVSDRRLFWSL